MRVAVVALANAVRRRRLALEVEARIDLVLAVREEELHGRPHVLSDDPAVAAAFSARDRKPMSDVGQRDKSVDNVYRLISDAARAATFGSTDDTSAEEFVGVAEIGQLLGVARNSAWRYTRRRAFPNRSRDPPQDLSGDKVDVEAWAAENLPLKRGRPPRALNELGTRLVSDRGGRHRIGESRPNALSKEQITRVSRRVGTPVLSE